MNREKENAVTCSIATIQYPVYSCLLLLVHVDSAMSQLLTAPLLSASPAIGIHLCHCSLILVDSVIVIVGHWFVFRLLLV